MGGRRENLGRQDGEVPACRIACCPWHEAVDQLLESVPCRQGALDGSLQVGDVHQSAMGLDRVHDSCRRARGFHQRCGDDGTLVLHGNVDIRQISLAFDGSGRVVQLRAEEDDRVKAGAVLGLLDTRAVVLQAEQAQAANPTWAGSSPARTRA